MNEESEQGVTVAIQQRVSAELVWANSLSITTLDDATMAIERLKIVKTNRAAWVSYWKQLKEDAHASWKGIVAREKSGTDLCDQVETIVKAKYVTWQQEQERKAQEEQRKLQAEADEKARRERARLEAEAAKLKTPELKQARMEEAAAVVAPVVSVAAPSATASGASMRKKWTALLISKHDLLQSAGSGGEVAASLLSFDQQAADALARATKGGVSVPGVKFVEVSDVAVRTR